ncbi:LuxR C-terminal-related transcriptional regulator [Nocardia sp. CA2R105]|uniref:ATP-binding protein n=1 Tax=Nocardia coffeae TaxID=2873381 RepID=UPI001CA6B3BF|nr:LuxR C-terminal-related transcriptional regulator [Nocardia coffeae]MBY8861951.1 LuxR C-terminal-related transcriptional regulator [Nocardia coffeae]
MTSFVGRQPEIRKVRALLSTARLVTLTGVGGAGKTRLAVEVAAVSGRTFPDGVWLVDLASVRDPDMVALEMMTSLGIVDLSNRSIEDRLVDHLRDQRVLVVLDNCEQVVDACSAVCEHLLRSCAQLRILATSRVSLSTAGEHVYPVLPLSMPTSDVAFTLAALAAYDAPTLLVERARAVCPDFDLTERDAPAAVRVCQRLDGIPLAIELAASRLRSLSLSEVLERLQDRFALLGAGTRTAIPRQRTLRALIDWSYELCPPAERLLWARLSVFTGGCTLAAAEHVCAGPDLPSERILDLIDHLVAQSILVVVPTDRAPRYRMLETIRDYGWDRLTEAGEPDTLRKRHCDYYLARSERIAELWNGPDQVDGLAELRAEHDNLQAALNWATSTPAAVSEALRLVTALRYHWCADGFLADGRRWTDRALQSADGNRPERIPALWVAAWERLLQGDQNAAEQALDECAARATEVGDHRAMGWVHSLRGTLALFRGDLVAPASLFERVVTEFSADEDLMRLTFFQLAITQAHSGDPRAGVTARQGIAMADRCGERWSKSSALWALGYHHQVHGEYDEAVAAICAGLEIQREFHDPIGTSLLIETLAWTVAARGEHRRAARLLGAVASEWQRIGTSIETFGPYLNNPHVRCERTVSAALPEDVLHAEYERGASLDHKQAIDCADDRRRHTPVSSTSEEAPADSADELLTPRERQVAELVAQGLSNRRIAERLVVSRRTIEHHVENIFGKLGFSSRTQVAAWTAHRHGPDSVR